MSQLTYQDALAWIYSFSDTERTGDYHRDREDNLPRERALLAQLGDPHSAYGVTHIAGTKGKGSTSAMLASILRTAGVRTGLYTSPDLHTFRERIQVDGIEISGEEVARLVPRVRVAAEHVTAKVGPFITWDVATALAFLAFRAARVRHAVIEVGLGGRLDATNVVEPLATAITSISYDHMHILGSTLGAIAGEKAGIVKPGVPLVCSARASEALEVISRIAGERGAPLLRVGPKGSADCTYTYLAGGYDTERQLFDVSTPARTYRDLELALLGEHQIENAAAAVALAETLRERAGLPIDEDAIRHGLRDARWPARMQVVRRAPWVVVDGAHNADSFARLFSGLRRHFPFERLILVFGLLKDKDLDGVVQEIVSAGVDAVVATAAISQRARPPEDLAAALARIAPHLPVTTESHCSDALDEALAMATPHDLICVTGSLYLAGEALRWLAAQPETPPGNIHIAGVDHP
jgi:dihydrofolate synthase / folylpolyglutamate synthase